LIEATTGVRGWGGHVGGEGEADAGFGGDTLVRVDLRTVDIAA
jgi:hypothetical protein